jgi:hypothetical protein
MNVGPTGINEDPYMSKDGGIYLRISDYIGYSFTPPSLSFEQGFKPESNAGAPVPDDSFNTYQVNDAQITIVSRTL